MFLVEADLQQSMRIALVGRITSVSMTQAKMPEPAEQTVPRFGPAAKAARAKEREEEKAKQKQQAKPAAKA